VKGEKSRERVKEEKDEGRKRKLCKSLWTEEGDGGRWWWRRVSEREKKRRSKREKRGERESCVKLSKYPCYIRGVYGGGCT